MISGQISDILFGRTGPRGGKHDGLVQSAAKSAARSVGSGIGRAILRGALGSILGGTASTAQPLHAFAAACDALLLCVLCVSVVCSAGARYFGLSCFRLSWAAL